MNADASTTAGWPLQRKLAAAAFAAVCVLGLVGFSLYLAAVLFLLLNKANPLQAHLASFFDYWRLYADDPALRKKLLGSLASAAFGTLVALPTALVAAAWQRRPLHGDARFANPGEVARAGLLGANAAEPRILIGRYRGRFLSLPGQLSVMLSAPTRSGKGVGVVIPNLLSWPDSVVVLDIKGENFAMTAGYRAVCKQKVYAFSPFDEEARSHRWNPLTAVRTGPLHRVGDLLAIGQVFYPTEGNTSSEAFFNDQARNLFLGLGLFLLETPELPRTIGEMLRQSSGKGRPIKDHLHGIIRERQTAGQPLTDECADAVLRLLANSENTLSSIVSTFNAPLTIFADAIVDAATSGDDFRLEDVRRERMSIYVRVPPNRLTSAKPLLNLFFSQLVSLNTRQLPRENPSLKWQCLLVHDEFAAMGRISVIAAAAAFLAGYNLRLLTIVQAMSQLDAVYGEKEARTFATNHGLQILFAPREQRDADEYSAMLGHFTERATSRGRSRSFGQHGHNSLSRNESDQRRALLLPQEFKEIGAERFVAIVENCKPILGEKIRYYRDKAFLARMRPAPAVPPMDMPLHIAKAQQRWRYADDVLEAGEDIDVGKLAHKFDGLPEVGEPKDGHTGAVTDGFLDAFFAETRVEQAAGGTIEPVSDELDLAVLETSAESPASPA